MDAPKLLTNAQINEYVAKSAWKLIKDGIMLGKLDFQVEINSDENDRFKNRLTNIKKYINDHYLLEIGLIMDKCDVYMYDVEYYFSVKIHECDRISQQYEKLDKDDHLK